MTIQVGVSLRAMVRDKHFTALGIGGRGVGARIERTEGRAALIVGAKLNTVPLLHPPRPSTPCPLPQFATNRPPIDLFSAK